MARLFRALNVQQRDPADRLTEAIIARDMFGPRPWMSALLAWSSGEEAVALAAWYPSYEPAYAARGAYLAALWVEPDRRRRGLAGRMLGQVAERVGAIGGEYLWWATKPWNADALAAYAAMGAFVDQSQLHVLVGESFQRVRRRAGGPPQPEERIAP